MNYKNFKKKVAILYTNRNPSSVSEFIFVLSLQVYWFQLFFLILINFSTIKPKTQLKH